MTLQELSRLYRLRGRLDRNRRLLESLEAAACPNAQAMDGMPRSQGAGDKTGDLAAEIADVREQTRLMEAEAADEEKKLKGYIRAIPDEYLRTVMSLRLVHGMAWADVASAVGGRNTANGVKSAFYRHLNQKS